MVLMGKWLDQGQDIQFLWNTCGMMAQAIIQPAVWQGKDYFSPATGGEHDQGDFTEFLL